MEIESQNGLIVNNQTDKSKKNTSDDGDDF